jgi:hypothetical protein
MPIGISLEAEKNLREDIGGGAALVGLVPPIVDIAIGLFDILFDQSLCGPHPSFLWLLPQRWDRAEPDLDRLFVVSNFVENCPRSSVK